MTDDTYDLVIVGGGPAGATLARRLAPGFRVLLVERRRLEDWRTRRSPEKPCGGLLAPDAQRALAAQGLGVPREIVVGPQLFAVRTIDGPSGVVRHYPRSYLNVDRGRFDAWLLSLVPDAVDVRTGTLVRAIRATQDGVIVELDAPGRIDVVRARLVVGADGALSRVRRLAFPWRGEAPAYAAVQEWCEARDADAAFTAVFDPAITDFYGWAIPKDGRLVVGAAVPTGSGAGARLALLHRVLARHGVRAGKIVRREGTIIRRPWPGDVVTGAGAVALVGEAAGFISPSSAEGISYALRSGAALAEALAPGLAGWAPRYRAATRGLLVNVALKRLKAPAMYFAPLRRALMRSGIAAVRVGAETR